jgi:hypothetical protein
MSTDRRRNLDAQTSDALLAGSMSTPAGQDRLVDMLALSSAPPRPAELAGRQAALAAFRAAQQDVTAGERTKPTGLPAVRTMLTLKILAALAGITAGGMAFAAGSGVLPNPFTPGSSPSSPAVHTSVPTPTPVTSTAAIQPSAIPSPAVVGLCRAYLNLPTNQRGKALSSTAFTELAAAAGNQDVGAYCTALLQVVDPQPTHHPTGGPEKPAKTPHPTPSHKGKMPPHTGQPPR